MGIFKWLKKATKVIGKMAVEAAEEDERSKYSPKPVPGPFLRLLWGSFWFRPHGQGCAP